MKKHDSYREGVATPRGRPDAIVAPLPGPEAIEIERFAPSADLAEFVDYHWLVRWTDVEEHVQRVVPQPRIHVATEEGRLVVHGVSREPFSRTLHGTGHVLGTAFHAGGFQPLLKRSVSSVAGAVVPAAELFGFDDRDAAALILSGGDGPRAVAVMETYLRRTVPEVDPMARDATALVAEAERRTDIVRADQLADHAGRSLRSLQRLFAEYVGIGPKWVIQRLRILDAVAAAHTGHEPDWAALAIRLGFSDQSHLIRTFTSVVGTPPGAYERAVDAG